MSRNYSLVEAPEVEAKMMALAKQIDPELLNMTDAQRATYNPAHALRDTFAYSWKKSLPLQILRGWGEHLRCRLT